MAVNINNMYTAKIRNKEEIEQGIKLTVEFDNGTKSFEETVIPQDKVGFNHWVASRIKSLNTLEELKEEDNIDKVVDLSTETDNLTQAEIDKQAWFEDYSKLIDVQKLIDLGVLSGSEKKIVELREKVKADFRPDYLNLI